MSTTLSNKGNPDVLTYQDIAQADMDTDASGDVSISINNLRVVEQAWLTFKGTAYFGVCRSITGRACTFRIYKADNDGGGAAAFLAHTSASNIGTALVFAIGQVK